VYGRRPGTWPLGPQVIEDALDGVGLSDEADHAHGAGASGADQRIDFVDTAEQICPSLARGRGVRRRCCLGISGLGLVLGHLVALTMPGRNCGSSTAAAMSSRTVSQASRASTPRSSRLRKNSGRCILGMVKTHWAWATSSRTWSARNAASSQPRFAAHEGHSSRCLQEKGTSVS